MFFVTCLDLLFMFLSTFQIYNEMIRDLLCPSSGVLELREDSNGVQVAGLSKFQAKSTREVFIITVLVI